MALFGTKKKKGSEGDDTEEQEPVVEASRGGGRKKLKESQRLDSVISESVVASALELLRQNKPFQLSPHAWMILVVSSENLGGLGKKYSTNEAKGQIIEHIEQDQIQVLATSGMLAEQVFGIIPTEGSLKTMEEYELLVTAPYVWSLVELDDDNGLTVKPMAQGGTYINTVNEETDPEALDGGYKEAVAIANGTLHLGDVLPELWAWAAEDRDETPEPAPAPYEEGPTGVLPAVPAEDEDEDPMSGAAAAPAIEDEGVNYGELDDEGPSHIEDDEPLEDEFVPAEPEHVEASVDPDEHYEGEGDEGADDEYLAYIEENEGRVVKEDEVRATIARRFLSDELALEIDLDEFNTMFNVEAPVIEFPSTPDSTDWLGSQVNQMVRQANAELERLHKDHSDELRETYVNLMGRHTEAVLDQVSMKKGDTIYVKMNAAADAEYDQAVRSIEEQASIQRKELNERFEEQVEQRAQQAAANARVEFHNRNRPQHEQNLAEVGVALQRRTEERREYRRQETLQWRSSEARKLMDLGTNKALQMLSERQAEQREVEMQMMRDWSDEMSRVIDANRKNDMVRASTLASQLEKDTRVEELRAEQRARLEEANADREQAIQRLRDELAADHEEHTRKLTARETELQAIIASERSRAEAAQATVESLSKQIDKADSRVGKGYREEIDRLKNTNKSKDAELTRAVESNKRTVYFLAGLMLFFAIMAGGVGLVLGWAISSGGDEVAPAPAMEIQQQAPVAPAPVE